MTDNISIENPNPKDPGQYWDLAGPFTRAELIVKARVRAEPLFSEVRYWSMNRWQDLTEPQREFVIAGMYDGIDCDNCGDYIPTDVPDEKERLCIGVGDSTICAVCKTLEQAANASAPEGWRVVEPGPEQGV